MTLSMTARCVTLICAALPLQAVGAQSISNPAAFMKRATELHSKHLDCAVSLGVARGTVRRSQPDQLPKFEEAMGSYFNRYLGVAAIMGQNSSDATKAVTERVRAAYVSMNAADKPTAMTTLAAHSTKSKTCLAEIGYSAN